MSHPEFDAIIVGASIAGSSAAIRLAQRGFRILLLDRAFFPRDKVCGEAKAPFPALPPPLRLGVKL